MIRAARYLKVAPWELSERSVVWRNLALAAERAEAEASSEPKPGGDPGAMTLF